VRNYVILNGVKSDTIKGLLISELPPISKPLMRTQIEEIDGRDGSIVTNLGYSAYEKQMIIGLFGDYDIDDVVQYFNSQGTVTFSNEPDKYYNYQIIKEIDFERLIRFRTATVTFYVQPFKYDAVDQIYTFNNQLLSIPDYSATKNGIELTVSNGQITVTGTGTAATEFYVPINPLTLDAGEYTLKATASGTKASACSIRLIKSVPSNADSFGGTYLGLQNNTSVSLDGEVTEATTYNYLWFYITAGNAMDFTLDVELLGDLDSFSLINRGNTNSKPQVTIYGEGTINFYLNGSQIFVIDLGEAEYITIDAAKMNAYQGNTLMNRSVTGDYDSLSLNVGTNIISWTGIVTEMIFENYSRWI
jgi:predicted phage tail component-like protein